MSAAISEKKLAANRANAQKSTGPRTPQGKRASARNAITHGVFCTDVVLPGEDYGAFEDLLGEMLAALKPRDAAELMLVEGIAAAQWRLRRLRAVRVRRFRIHRNTVRMDWSAYASPKKPDPDTADILALIADYEDPAAADERLDRLEQRLENMVHRNLNQLRKLRTPIRGHAEPNACPYVEEATEESSEQNEPTDPDAAGAAGATPENVQNEPTGEVNFCPGSQDSAQPAPKDDRYSQGRHAEIHPPPAPR